MRRAARRDANEGTIVDALRSMGCVVYAIGWPVDLLAILPDGDIVLMEVKTPTGRLRGQQVEFIQAAQMRGARVHIVRTLDDVLQALKIGDNGYI